MVDRELTTEEWLALIQAVGPISEPPEGIIENEEVEPCCY
jgi:hypothetical protein